LITFNHEKTFSDLGSGFVVLGSRITKE